MKKPNFTDVPIDTKLVCWAVGNKLVGMRVLATIKLRELTEEEEKKQKEEYEEFRKIYDENINVGSIFRAKSKSAIKDDLKITGINPKTMTVTWKQIMGEKYKDKTISGTDIKYKPAKGKWTICGMIQMVRMEHIIFDNK